MSVWDDPEIRTSGDYVKFENVGDTVSGTITAVRPHRFDDGSVVPEILLITDDGEEKSLTAGQVRLKAELATLRPEAGDHITIQYTNEERRAGGKTLKHWAVQVRRGQNNAPPLPPLAAAFQPPPPSGPPTAAYLPPPPPAAPAAPPTAPAPDPAALIAALANLTPEQRTAMGLPAA